MLCLSKLQSCVYTPSDQSRRGTGHPPDHHPQYSFFDQFDAGTASGYFGRPGVGVPSGLLQKFGQKIKEFTVFSTKLRNRREMRGCKKWVVI